jgi:hypothetical protein
VFYYLLVNLFGHYLLTLWFTAIEILSLCLRCACACVRVCARGLFHSCHRLSAPHSPLFLLHQSSSALSLASFTSSVQPRYVTLPTFLGHLASPILLACPYLINYHFCTSSVMSFPISIISPIVSFRFVSNPVLPAYIPHFSLMFHTLCTIVL